MKKTGILLGILFAVNLVFCQTIVIYGDSRTNDEEHQKIVNQIIKFHPAMVFHTGDLVAAGTSDELWKKYLKITEKLRKTAVIYPVIGNHELGSSKTFTYLGLKNGTQNAPTWYSLEYGKFHFTMLNSSADYVPGSAQYNWLIKDLNKARVNNKSIIVLFHYPVFYLAEPTKSELDLQKYLVPVFDSFLVKAVFNGHKHNYTRSNYHHIYYVVTGGGGAPLYDLEKPTSYLQKYIKTYHFCVLNLNGNKAFVRVINDVGKEIDSFTIE
jgi:acid phosphatase type 7